jgi:hypothetical protein
VVRGRVGVQVVPSDDTGPPERKAQKDN